MISKFVSKLIQSLPTWEVTKYYGRVCIYQLKCLKYKVQTSEAWFNFKCKFMPGSLQNELECKESIQPKSKDEQPKQQKLQKKNQYSESLLNNVKSSYIADKFVTTTKTRKTQETEKNQENKDYIMREKYIKKKQRKMKHVQ